MDCTLPDSSIHGIFQARVLEWVAISLLQGTFPTQGSNPGLHALWADALPSQPLGKPVAQMVKNPPVMWETWVPSLGWEGPLEKGKATHSSILAWRIPWTVHAVAESWT